MRRAGHACLAAVAFGLALWLGLGLGLCSCREGEPAQPGKDASQVLLEVDGITVTRGDLAEYYPYLDSLDPHLGLALRDSMILDEILQVRLARRWFARDRDELLRAATALVKAAPTLTELEAASKLTEDKSKRGFAFEHLATYADLPPSLALRRAVFDKTKLGQVQGPIETPFGFAIVGTRRIEPGLTRPADRADPWLVYYWVHESRAKFDAWWESARKAARTRLTFVHPDLKDSLPEWMQP